jgi:hypothetical protein
LAVSCLVAWSAVGGTASAQYRETFDSTELSWRLADADCGIRILAHRRDFQNFHAGGASEHLQVTAGQGSYAYLISDIPAARLIAEWVPRMWVKADRGGLQLMARIVLPRAIDPANGKPMTALLRGDLYDRVGMWQALRIDAAQSLLDREVRVLRSHFGPEVDAREAFVDLIVLNAYGGPGVTNLWIDDLEISGHVDALRFSSHAVPEASTDRSTRDALPAGPSGAAAAPNQGPAQVNGSVTLAGGRPLFPRVIEYNGEPFDHLQALGFNAIKLAAPPTSIQLREAQRLGLWLVSPPPNDLAITSAHERVLAWHLGRRLAADRLELTRQWIGQLRRAEVSRERPVMGEAVERVWSYSRLLDLIELDRTSLGTTSSLSACGRWIEQRPTLARPGTPHWVTVQTEPAAELVDQWMALGLGTPLSVAAEQEQVRLLAFQAVASGARGLIFRSRTPLDNADNDAQTRARVLRRLNMDLELIEPWVSGGTRASEVSPPAANARVTVLQTERSQLLMITDNSTDQQYTSGGSLAQKFSLVVPGAATAPQVYLLQPGGLRTLTHQRVAGGIRIEVPDRNRICLIAVTQEPLVIAHLARTLAQHTVSAARLQYELAAGELELVEMVHERLVGQTPSDVPSDQWLAQAKQNLRHCEVLLGGNDYAAAHTFAERTIDFLGQVRRTHWQRAVDDFPSPAASPCCATFAALPLHWEMARRLQSANAWSPNRLPAGDFENLGHLRDTGWQNLSISQGVIQASAELAPQSPRGGGTSLRLLAQAADARDLPPALESPPVRVITPPISLRQGQLARVHGWLYVPQEIQSSPDGLMVYDSLAGTALAERISSTNGWREFVLYRAAPVDGPLSVTFALTGLGEAYLDDVTISVHESIADRYSDAPADQARRLPPVPDVVR